jgi:protein TonB
VAAWKNKVLRHIRRRLPEMREAGKVDANINITASGEIVAVRMTRSSGNPRLDKAALKALRRSSPVPAPPDGRSWSIGVPVRFELE